MINQKTEKLSKMFDVFVLLHKESREKVFLSKKNKKKFKQQSLESFS